jgi:hypothetical protein
MPLPDFYHQKMAHVEKFLFACLALLLICATPHFLSHSSSYHEFMYKSMCCEIVSFKNEPWKGKRTEYFLGY